MEKILREDSSKVTNELGKRMRGKVEGLSVDVLAHFIDKIREEARDALFNLQVKLFEDIKKIDEEIHVEMSRASHSTGVGGIQEMLVALSDAYEKIAILNTQKEKLMSGYKTESAAVLEDLFKKYNLM